MKKTSQLIALFITAIYLTACSGDAAETVVNAEAETTADEHEHGADGHEHTHGEDELGISLNEGVRWIANIETTEGIAAMHETAEMFQSEAGIATYAALADSLEAQFNGIFKACTMTGEAHEQLHTFLMPLKDMIGWLRGEDEAACETTRTALVEHLHEYATYFE